MTETLKQPSNLESNIWKYAVSLIINKRFFTAIVGAYYLTIPGVVEQTIGLIFLIGSLAAFLFEIPSGYVSDKIGHKQALVIAHLLMLLSTSAYLWAESITLLIVASVFLSVSNAFRSGTGSAFMHETLRGLGRDSEYTKVMGKVSSIGFAVPIALAVAVPFLVGISFKLPFAIALVVDIIGLITAFSLVVPVVPAEHVKELRSTNFKQVLKEGWQLGYFKYALFNAVVAGMLMGIGVFRAPYQIWLEIPVIWFGVLHGLGRVLASTMLYFSGQMRGWFGDILTFYRFRIILYSFLILLLVLIQNPWVAAGVLLVINGFQWGLSQVSQGFILDIIKDSKFKATLLSVSSQFRSLLSGLIVLVVGIVITDFSYQIAFAVLLVVFFLVISGVYWYIANETNGQKLDKI